MAAITIWHRYGKKLRHCHPVYKNEIWKHDCLLQCLTMLHVSLFARYRDDALSFSLAMYSSVSADTHTHTHRWPALSLNGNIMPGSFPPERTAHANAAASATAAESLIPANRVTVTLYTCTPASKLLPLSHHQCLRRRVAKAVLFVDGLWLDDRGIFQVA